MESRICQIKQQGLKSPTKNGQAGRLTCAKSVGLGGSNPDQVGGRLYASQARRLTYALVFALASASALASPFPYHLPPVSCSSVGAGLATLAEGDDPSTVFWNPAGIAMMNQMAALLTLTSLEGGKPASWSILIANSSNRDASQFGLGFIRRHTTNSAGEFTSFEVLNPLAYRQIRSQTAWGFTPKFVAENFGEKWVYGMKLDAGVSMKTGPQSMTVLALVMQNCLGSNLRAFAWDSWGGIKSATVDNSLRMYLQVRLDKPFKPEYLSENYRLGAKYRLVDSRMPELCVGLIRERGIVQYTAGLSQRAGARSSLLEYAAIWNPEEKNSFAHYLTYGYHIAGGTPTSPGTYSW